ncbi:MAG TPA: diacylglycerol kinase family protein [Flavisolibacter sp.]|nr:diacylglycerol kinase family protein [Flavisolibacter sp.]
MQNQERSKILFVINPVSGGKEKHDWEASIRDFFKGKPYTIDFYLLTGKNDKISIQHYIERVKPDKVVAVGGDGTIKMLADILKETKISLGILPAGSANGMAKELKIPAIAEEALNIIIAGESKKLDLVRINEEHICFHLSDVGLNALLIKHFEGTKGRGMWGYGKVVLKALWKKTLMSVSIKTDTAEIKRRAFMVVIANAQTYGTGAIINPEGKLNDGVFEIVVVRKLHLFELLKMLITHKPFHQKRIEVFQTKNVELHLKRKAYFQVDGEYLGKTICVKARVLPQILNVILPLEKKLA